MRCQDFNRLDVACVAILSSRVHRCLPVQVQNFLGQQWARTSAEKAVDLSINHNVR